MGIRHYRCLLRACLEAHPHLEESLAHLRHTTDALDVVRMRLNLILVLAAWVPTHDGRSHEVLRRESHLAARACAEAVERARER